MIKTNINSLKAQKTWDKLYIRLEQDGLLTTDTVYRKSTKTTTLRWAAAIAVLCLSIVSLYYVMNTNHHTQQLLLYNQDESMTLAASLADGSLVYLDNNSSLQYPEFFAKGKREVVLEGNAFFEVSGNPQQPFIIDAGQVLIEVIGTSFEVKNAKDSPFELAVREGQVKASLKGSDQIKYVSKDETVYVSASGLEIASINNPGRFNKYLNQVFFKDMPLKDIIHSINSRNEEIQLAVDPSLASNRLTVSFLNESPETIAELICFSLNLSYTKIENTLLISQP